MAYKGFCQQHRTQKVFSVMGTSFINSPIIIHYIWGNLSTYVFSYLNKKSVPVSGAEVAWASCLFLVAQGITIFPSNRLIHLVGSRATAIIGIIVFNVGVFASYLAVRHSVILVNFTLGVVAGIGAGPIYAAVTSYGVQWSSEKDIGMIMGIIMNSYNVLAMAINELITFYVNPLNESPDLVSGDYVFFSQHDILERVPVVFLIIGTIFLSLQIVGLLMVRDIPSPSTALTLAAAKEEDQEDTVLAESTESSLSYESIPGTLEKVKDVSPRQLLHTASFYVLWIGFLTSEFTFMAATSYFKAFGQLWISDDHFLTELGTSFVVGMVIVKVLTGFALDKIDCKYVLMLFYGTTAVCGGFFYVAPRINKWLYFVLVVVPLSFSGSAFMANTVIVVQMFGRKHAVVNTGLMNTATITMMLAAPMSMELLMHLLSWSGLFFTGAFLAAIGFILITVGIEPSKLPSNEIRGDDKNGCSPTNEK